MKNTSTPNPDEVPFVLSENRVALAYAKPEWLVTYRDSKSGELRQSQADFTPSFIRRLMAENGHVITSMCRVGDGYRPAIHQLALDLAWFNTHP